MKVSHVNGQVLEDRAGRVLMPERVELDETCWLGTHDPVERAVRLDACRALLRELTSGAIPCRFRRDEDREEWTGTLSISPSLRAFWKHGQGRAASEIARLEVFWSDGPALRATAPTLELDFGHATESLRGVTWTIRRCS